MGTLCPTGVAAQDDEFAPTAPIATGLTGLKSVVIADLDGDGDGDILAGTGQGGMIVWYESNGNTNPQFPVMHVIADDVIDASHVSVSDLDGDGDLDVLAGVRVGSTVATWYANMGGLPPVFEPRVLGSIGPNNIGSRVNVARAGDIDADGDNDVVIGYYVDPLANNGHVVWYKNNGDVNPTFAPVPLAAPQVTLENISDLALADLDANGSLDIAGVSETPMASGGRNRVFWWSSSGGANPVFQFQSIDGTLIDPISLAVAQISGSSAPDLAVAAAGSNQVVVFQSSGGPAPTFSPAFGFPLNDPRSVIAVNIESDGDTDLAVALGGGADAVVFESNGQPMPTFTPRSLGTTGGFCADIVSGHLTDDNRVDLAAVFPGSGQLDWFEQVIPIQNASNGTFHSTFQGAIAGASSGQTIQIPAERLARDPVIDLTGKALVLQSDDSFIFGADSIVQLADGASLQASQSRPIVLDGLISIPGGASLDIQGNAGAEVRSDLTFFSGASLNSATALSVSGTRNRTRAVIDGDPSLGAFQNLIGRPIEGLSIRLASGEFGVVVAGDEIGGVGETHPAALAVYAPDQVSVTGWLGYPIDAATPSQQGPIAVGDLNGDGLEDIASIRQMNGVPQLRIHLAMASQTPVFTSTTAATSIDAQHLFTIDLDYDGDVDLVTGQGWFRSSGGAIPSYSFTPFPLVSGLQSFGLIVCDVDLDGGRDIVVHCEKRTSGIPGRVGFSLYVLHSDAAPMPAFTPVLVLERDYESKGLCDGSIDCYPIANIELTGLNTLSREDQNMDSLTDLFLSEEDGITLLMNQSTTGPSFQSFQLTTDNAYDELVPVDYDGDHDIDLIATSMRGSRLRVLENISGTSYQETETIKPALRASCAVVLENDIRGVSRLAILGTGHDRVEIIDRLEYPGIELFGSDLDVAGSMQIGRGELVLVGGQVVAGNDVIIGPRGLLAGSGQVQANVWNAGVVRPRGDLTIGFDYTQYLQALPGEPGSLHIGLRSALPPDIDRLIVGGSASLDGSLILSAGSSFQPEVGVLLDILLANDLDDTDAIFSLTHMPKLTVLQSGDPTDGVLYPIYTDLPGGSSVQLVPTPMDSPMFGRSDFLANATPSDAVVADITGGPNGGPDGYADTAIAYPDIPGAAAAGGVAVFTGAPGQGSTFAFESLSLYTGKASAKPVAIEAGDYDGDGKFELAVGNSLTTTNQTLVFLLSVDSSSPTPVTDSQIPPLLVRTGARILDLASADVMPAPSRPGSSERVGGPIGLVVLTDIEDSGVATAAAYIGPGWDTCDVDVCDDPDSVDPIDVDGAGATLIEGYCATSNTEDKVVIAANPASSPGMFDLIAIDVGDGPTELRAEDLNNDGFPDIVTINEVSGDISVLVNKAEPTGPGGRGFEASLLLPLRADPGEPDPLPSSVALADLDDDGDLDIAVVSTNASGVRAVRRLDNQFIETGELTFSSVVDLAEQPLGVPLLVREADLDGGGIALNDDLVVYIDPGASPRSPVFGPTGGHITIRSTNQMPCLADVNGDGMLTPGDFTAWIAAFNSGSPACDQNSDGLCEPSDFTAWIANYNAGCP